MNVAYLFDAPSAAIVIGGTMLATVLRCGLADCKLALKALGRLGRGRFDSGKIQSELAIQVREIQKDGLLRAHPHVFGDPEFDDATGALIQTRSISGLLEKHSSYRERRLAGAATASQTFAQAAELAPLFGLAGTLIALSQLPANDISGGTYASAISTAVLTTLYGLLTANLILAPLSRSIDRASAIEEAEREKLVDWLTRQVAQEVPGSKQRQPDKDP